MWTFVKDLFGAIGGFFRFLGEAMRLLNTGLEELNQGLDKINKDLENKRAAKIKELKASSLPSDHELARRLEDRSN